MAKQTRTPAQPKASRTGTRTETTTAGLEVPKGPPVVTFVGETGPGAVINQYLPQPGHHTGRRIIKIEDTPDKYWLNESSSAGTAWADYLGIDKSDDNIWEVRKPEKLAEAWFGARMKRRPTSLGPALRQVEVELAANAREELVRTGSLRNWAQGRSNAWTRKGPRARMSSPAPDGSGSGSGSGPTLPDIPSDKPHRNPPRDEQQEQDDAATGFQGSLIKLDGAVVKWPASTWGGGITDVDVDVSAPPEPALFLIQEIGISSFLGDYGLGRTVKTFTLLPGETTTISTRTWRASEESVSQASSIIDSYDESSSERFAETVMSETTDTATREKTENWHAEAEAKGSIGIAGASVSGGGGGEYSSSTEEFSKAVDESVAEHASEASSHRENSVTSTSERTVSTEDEEVTERTIKNINVSRTLNFAFRELNQKYSTKTHLKDLKVAFSNGNVGTWREEPISGLRKLIEEVIRPEHVDEVCRDIISTIAIARDWNGTPVRVLEQVRLGKCGIQYQVHDAEPNDDCVYPAPTFDGRLYYRFKRGALAQDPKAEHPVDGVLLAQRDIMLATDSVVAEALLGTEPALDAYSAQLQTETIRERRLASNREELAQQIVSSGDAVRAGIFAQVFGVAAAAAEETSG